ncbi:hypothetical protein Q0A17_21205 [Citrobacter sp. S2-9]|uniref:Uncharacterized protein n=1 Tax=Citrobacter enshiensis TaxID=2971264 RepID=A0ABT8Q0R3_9ENTR|nr:hypothetical protein [Citrobacter enshiensis]ECA4267747.1 hypothetical protein [Salmonella enterica subsp. enterica serovar Java]EDL4059722.1 hypothetical protein [Salmonella enterica subsp. enterica serovar Infantis]EDO2727184.1 hypothetical protein [Salmonella enterica]MDN8601907.1 hypothetical protein [Citrobacter enshiensis]EDI9296983.1 hypothetical protein [Salmonella enterica subsp. enterica serovar Java]
MTPEILNTFGLCLNIVGVVLIFFFGLPQPSHDEEVSLGVGEGTVFADGRTAKSMMDEVRRRKKRYQRRAFLALTLMLLGFLFQLVSIWFLKLLDVWQNCILSLF